MMIVSNADVCSTGGSGTVVCGDSGSCPAVATDGACLAGGNADGLKRS